MELLDRALAMVGRGGRLLGLTGPPGAGKSTLAAQLATAASDAGVRTCVVPMDGFHLADEELDRLGRRDRKGAPDTFDADGFVAALARIRTSAHDVLVPRFDRALEAAIAGAIRVPVDAQLVITEGNYLLLTDDPWAGVRPLLDECWMLEPDDTARLDRLIARHEGHGRSPAEARAWVREVDERNTALVRSRSRSADLVVTGWS